MSNIECRISNLERVVSLRSTFDIRHSIFDIRYLFGVSFAEIRGVLCLNP